MKLKKPEPKPPKDPRKSCCFWVTHKLTCRICNINVIGILLVETVLRCASFQTQETTVESTNENGSPSV